MIRNFVAGYPGSIHDSRIWNECSILKDPEKYFTDGIFYERYTILKLTEMNNDCLDICRAIFVW